jgi:V/A-type H+/Na+-transporting ATPase subunit I
MARLDIQRVRIGVPRDEATALLSIMHDFGSAELIDESDETLTRTEPTQFAHTHTVAEIDTQLSFLKRFARTSFFRGIFEGGREHTTADEITRLAATYNIDETLEKSHTITVQLNEIDAKIKNLQNEVSILTSWQNLDIPLQDICNTHATVIFPVRGTRKKIDACKEAISAEPLAVFTSPNETTGLVIAHHEVQEAVHEILRTHDLEIMTLPLCGGSAKEELARIYSEIQAYQEERTALEDSARRLAEHELPTLKKVADHAHWRSIETSTALTRPHTAYTTIVDCWVPAREIGRLTTLLESKLLAVAVEARAPLPDEQPPVELHNRGFFHSFETITRLYGVPSNHDLDPTPFVSVFFFLFFGFCLSDTGYGLILMTLTGIVLWRYKLTRGMRQLMATLFFGGVGAFFFGILFGGYLGVAPADIHPALVPLQQFDPIQNPLPVFYFALIFGALHVSFGLVLDIVRAMRYNTLIDGLLDNVPWLMMFATFALMIVSYVGLFTDTINTAVQAYWGYAAIGIAVLIMITKGRHGKGIFGKISSGVLSLYGGVGYFADILSYSRLLALGLATGALAFSINLIAGFIGGDSLGVGTIFMVIILILGHTLNIVLSTLGAFINSARLQFVEFFSKFLTGTGRPFNAFRKEERNVILLPDTPM